MSEVAALIRDRTLYERLRAALSVEYPVRLVPAADELWAALRERPVALVVLETGPHSCTSVPSIVRTVRARYPSVLVVAYCRMRRGFATDVLDLAHAGVHDLVFADFDDDRPRLMGLVNHAAHRSATDDVIAHATAAGVSSEGIPLLRAFLDAAARPLSVQGIAGGLNIPRRTLFKRLAGTGLPSPRELSGWCRLLVAARLLDDPTHTIEYVAHTLGFASGNALRNLLQRHAGLSPTVLRTRGGFPYLRDRFVEHIARPQAARRRARDRQGLVLTESRHPSGVSGPPAGRNRSVPRPGVPAQHTRGERAAR